MKTMTMVMMLLMMKLILIIITKRKKSPITKNNNRMITINMLTEIAKATVIMMMSMIKIFAILNVIWGDNSTKNMRSHLKSSHPNEFM